MLKFFIILPIHIILGIILLPVVYRILPEDLFNGIVFYRGLLAASLIFVLQSLIAITTLVRKKSELLSQIAGRLSLLTAAFIALSFNIAFLAVVPVTLDRSVSTYLLEAIENRNSATVSELQDLLINDYVINRKAIARRIEEQLTTGNIVVTDDKVQLSQQGQNFLDFGKLIKKIFMLKDRSIQEP